jgi:hypothetical protein
VRPQAPAPTAHWCAWLQRRRRRVHRGRHRAHRGRGRRRLRAPRAGFPPAERVTRPARAARASGPSSNPTPIRSSRGSARLLMPRGAIASGHSRWYRRSCALSARIMATRAHDEQVTVLALRNAAQAPPHQSVRIDHDPRLPGERISRRRQHRASLLPRACPTRLGRHDRFEERLFVDGDEHQLRARRPRELRSQDDGVAPGDLAVDAHADPDRGRRTPAEPRPAQSGGRGSAGAHAGKRWLQSGDPSSRVLRD